ncbi:MAG: hypothetical protein HQL72_03300 [Magnetococcales bacterium]|nr:hypothetical protein [Magnetococcales bacterium]
MSYRARWRTEQGFTLAQMAVVILLSGILMTMGIVTTQALKERTAVAVTQKRLDGIEQAFKTYLSRSQQENRLPCPDTVEVGRGGTPFDGVEDRVDRPNGGCLVQTGLLPYVTLGLQRRGVLDGWDHFFSYTLDDSKEQGWGTPRSHRPNLDESGHLTVIRRHQNGVASGRVQDAILVVVSHGRNGLGSYTLKGTRTVVSNNPELDESENSDGDDRFVERDHTDRADYKDDKGTVRGAFDDILLVMGITNLVEGVVTQTNRSLQPSLSSDIATAQYDLRRLNKAADRFNRYLITYVDNYPQQTNPPGKGEREGEGRLGDLWDSHGDENQLGGDKENHFLDPLNKASPSIDPLIGLNFLSQNQQGGEQGEGALALLKGVSTGVAFIPSALANDPWGEAYLWDRQGQEFFSKGPDRACQGGDDITVSAQGKSLGGTRCSRAN